jgi:hypothetical protein
MASALRLPPRLDALARAYAADLGISVNGLVCVLLDAHARANPLPSGSGASAPAAPPGRPSKPAAGGKSKQLQLDVGEAAPVPGPARKVSGKKETFKDRQRARDTAFSPSKAR